MWYPGGETGTKKATLGKKWEHMDKAWTWVNNHVSTLVNKINVAY